MMAMRKLQSVEKIEIVSPKGHEEINVRLAKVGATSAKTLTDKERVQVNLLDSE
jgi:hypothetical protein